MSDINYQTVEVGSVNIAYREAGVRSLPNLVLMHGHASGSHTFRNLMPLLSSSFHIVAPDYPGFGNSDRPELNKYEYTFVNLADTMDKFLEKLGLSSYVLYLFDFSAPIGLLIVQKHPERIAGLFSQSGNAYDEGLSPAFDGIRAWWAAPENAAKKEPLRHMFSEDGLRGAYFHGVPPTCVSPDAPNLDVYYTSRSGAVDIQFALLRDYETNVKSYPEWQAYLRKHQPKLVAVWGKHDPFFAAPGAEAFKRDLPDADVTLIDAGHFVLESHPRVIADAIKKLL